MPYQLMNYCNRISTCHLYSIVSTELDDVDNEDIDDGSMYKCTYGYKFFLVSCIDIDECTEGLHNCNPGEICFNYDGGYRCDMVNT